VSTMRTTVVMAAAQEHRLYARIPSARIP